MSELLVVHASGTNSNSDIDILCSGFDRQDKKKAIMEICAMKLEKD